MDNRELFTWHTSEQRLGHDKLDSRHPSVEFANKVAEKKVKEQPEAPVNGSEVMNAMPTSMAF